VVPAAANWGGGEGVAEFLEDLVQGRVIGEGIRVWRGGWGRLALLLAAFLGGAGLFDAGLAKVVGERFVEERVERGLAGGVFFVRDAFEGVGRFLGCVWRVVR
jgi:hypothetical protein